MHLLVVLFSVSVVCLLRMSKSVRSIANPSNSRSFCAAAVRRWWWHWFTGCSLVICLFAISPSSRLQNLWVLIHGAQIHEAKAWPFLHLIKRTIAGESWSTDWDSNKVNFDFHSSDIFSYLWYGITFDFRVLPDC
jgi:hypothetical protein